MSERQGWSFVPKDPERAKMYEVGEALAAVSAASFQMARIEALMPYLEQVISREEIAEQMGALHQLSDQMAQEEKPDYGFFVEQMANLYSRFSKVVYTSDKFEGQNVYQKMDAIEESLHSSKEPFVKELNDKDPHDAHMLFMRLHGQFWDTGHFWAYASLSKERKEEEGPLGVVPK